MRDYYFLAIICLFFGGHHFVFSQSQIPISASINEPDASAGTPPTTTDHRNVDELDNLDKIELPPLSVFLDAAESYADVRFYKAKAEEERQNTKVTQKEWLKYVRLIGAYQYGTNNTLVTQSGEINPTDPRFSVNTQSWYNGGVQVSIPLDDLFSRKNKSNAAKSRVEQSRYEQERALESRKLEILAAYNEVVKNLVLLKINAESVALYNAQMQISEKDFANGRIDIIALSLERGRRTEANIKYETSRAALHNAVSILEMLTKIKISRRK